MRVVIALKGEQSNRHFFSLTIFMPPFLCKEITRNVYMSINFCYLVKQRKSGHSYCIIIFSDVLRKLLKCLSSDGQNIMKTRTMKFTTLALGAAMGLATFGAVTATPAHAADIVETAKSTGMFNTLLAAANAAGVAPMLMNDKNLTVFAPTDAAFDKLPAGTVDMLLKPENKATLKSILAYHVLTMKVPAKAAMKLPSGTNVKTANGEKFIVRKMNGKLMIDPGVGMPKPPSSSQT